MSRQKGITLLEVLFTLSLIFILVSAIFLVYIAVLRGWDQLGRRNDLHEKLNFAVERIVRDVRNANAISVPAGTHSLRFTLNESGTNNSYIYYLYNASDSWVPNFNQASYDLRRAGPLAGGINGTFTYGSGDLIITNLKPPSGNTSITISGNYAIVNLVSQSSTETLNVRGYVRPRNL